MLTNLPTTQDPRSSSVQLPAPFDRLVANQTLTESQAHAVITALAERSQPSHIVAPSGPHTLRTGLAGRLAEIGAYLGAALVLAAGIVVVAQQWAEMSYAVRVSVMGGTAAALTLAAGGVVVFAHGRAWDDIRNGDTLRRLSGTLFSLGAAAAFGTVMVAMLSGQDVVTESEASQAFIVAGLTAMAILVIARLRADTPLGELGLFAASVAVTVGAIQLWFTDETVVIQWTVLTLGLAWALAATFTQLMRYRVLVTCLGLFLAFFGSATIAEEAWSQRLALVALIVIALAVYLTRPQWPYIAAATVAAVVLTVTWVGEAVGAAMALLAAGLVVLVLAGGALLWHARRRADDDVLTRQSRTPG